MAIDEAHAPADLSGSGEVPTFLPTSPPSPTTTAAPPGVAVVVQTAPSRYRDRRPDLKAR